MKTSFRITALFLIMSCALSTATVQAAQYYVVIGSFEDESNARKFTGAVRQSFHDVSYTFNQSKKLYYVHVLRTSRKEEARKWSLYLRREKGFKDAWVLTEAGPADQQVTTANHQRPRFQSSFASAFHASMPASAAPELSVRKKSMQESQPQELSSQVYADAAPVTHRVSDASNAAASWTVAGDLAFLNNVGNTRISGMGSSQFVKLFRFIIEDAKGTSMPSEVMLVNFEKMKKLASFQPGENVAIKGTKPEQMVTFVCDVLGYHQETRMFNLDHLSRGKDVTKNEQGIWEVRIKLKKLGVHEIGVMNKTIFHRDAAILETSSRAELDELVTLMKNNPGYKIILHSHCNPGANRPLKIAAADDNYFDLEDAVEKNGSDKLLTKKRAELVRNYLTDHGIDKKRIGVVSWGSLELVVRSGSEEDYVNDRIEVELAALNAG